MPHQIEKIMPKKKTPYSKDAKLAELLTEDRRLLQLLPRFGLALGFGEHSVEQVCQTNHVNTDLFLMICEIYSDSSFKPEKEELRHIDLGDLLSYLKLRTAIISTSVSRTSRNICNTSLMPADRNSVPCSAIFTMSISKR